MSEEDTNDFLVKVFSEYEYKRNRKKIPMETEKIVAKNIEIEAKVVKENINAKNIINEENSNLRGRSEYVRAKNYANLLKIVKKPQTTPIKEAYVSTDILFEDKDSKLPLIIRKLNKENGEYNVKEIEFGNYDKEIARMITLSSYVGTIDTKLKKLEDIYYEIKNIVKEFYTKNNKDDIDNSIVKVSYYILKDVTYKIITPLFFDHYIEDINGVEDNYLTVFYSGKITGKNTNVDYSGDYVTNIKITKEEIDELIKLFIEKGNDSITKQERVKSVTLPTADAARFTAIYPYINGGNMAFSIRKQVFNLIPPNVLIKNNSVTVDALAYISWAMDHVETGKIAVVGLPASGKTTFLKTISFFIPYAARVFSIETTPELQLTQRSWTRQIQVTETKQQTALINASLMFRPDYVIVGEVKLEKDLVDSLFSIIASGEKTLFTFHANSPSTFITKFQSRSLEISKDRVANLSYMLFVVLDPVTHVRYLASIDEIYGYDEEKERVLWKNLMSMTLKDFGTDSRTKKKDLGLIYNTRFTQAGEKYISYNIFKKFIEKAELNIEKDPLTGDYEDQLLLMILNSELLKDYVEIHNIDLELEDVFNEDGSKNYPLTYWKTYKLLYNEMSEIRGFLAREASNESDVDEFLTDYRIFYNNRSYLPPDRRS